MMLDASAIKEIVRLAEEKETVVRPMAEPPNVYYLRQADGTLERRVATEPAPNITVRSVAALERLLVLEKDIGMEVRAFYNGGAIRLLVFDVDNHCYRHHILPLIMHPVMKQLQAWAERPASYSQAAFTQLLRSTLRGWVEDDLVSTMRALKLKVHHDGEIAVDHSGKNLSRRVLSEVIGQNGSLPDEFIVNTRVYQLPELLDFSWGVAVTLEATVENDEPVLKVQAVGDHLIDATNEALSALVEPLKAHDVPLIFGDPGQ